MLGHVLPAMEAEFDQSEDNTLPMVAMTEHKPERIQALLDAVSISDSRLTEVEHERLKKFIVSNADLFALEPAELGITNAVTRTINTGDQPPVRQHPYRTHSLYGTNWPR